MGSKVNRHSKAAVDKLHPSNLGLVYVMLFLTRYSFESVYISRATLGSFLYDIYLTTVDIELSVACVRANHQLQDSGYFSSFFFLWRRVFFIRSLYPFKYMES